MSVAPELPPIVHIPARARRGPRALTLVALGTVAPGTQFTALAGEPGGVVIPLRAVGGFGERLGSDGASLEHPFALDTALTREFEARPAATRPEPTPVRLTARGRVVLALLALVTAGLLLLIAHASLPASAATPSSSVGSAGAAVVAVQPGDTLWSIASRAAPRRDPRAEVLDLQVINHLSGVDVYPGQVLHVK
jgi:LysM repeat protein